MQPGAADGLAAAAGCFKSTFLTLKKAIHHVPSKPCLELLPDSDICVLCLVPYPGIGRRTLEA